MLAALHVFLLRYPRIWNSLLGCSPLLLGLAALVVLGCTGWLVFECARVWRQSERSDRLRFLAGSVVLLAGLAHWLLLVPPTYLHSNVMGPALVDTAAACSGTRSDEFGLFGFLVQASLLRFIGVSLASLAGLHALFGGLTFISLALGVRQLSGSLTAALGTLVFGVAWLPFARVIRSEDMHNVGGLLSAILFLGLITFAREGRRLPAWVAIVAGSLLTITRQTFLPWIWLMAVLALVLARASLRRRWPEFLGILAMLGVTIARAIYTSGSLDDGLSVKLIPLLLLDPAVWASVSRYHPWFDVSVGAAIILPLSLFGLALLLRRGVAGVLYVLGTLAYFVVTLPLGVPTPGDNLGFRIPVLFLVIGAAGVGMAELLRWLPRRGERRILVREWIVLLVTALVLMTAPGRAELLAVSPLVPEEEFLQDAGKELDREATLFLFRSQISSAPSYRGPPRSTWRGPQLQLASDGPEDRSAFAGHRVYFFQGLSCFMYSTAELYTWTHPYLRRADVDVPWPVVLQDLRTILLASYRNELPPGVSMPPGLRPECARIARHAKRIGPSLRLPRPPDELPFSVYSGDVELALYEVDPSLLDEPPIAVPSEPVTTTAP